MLDICLLGTGGMQPLPGRRLSATLIRAGAGLVLFDCGEGTQVAIRECGWGLRNIKAILLSHMHADHVLGLPGLLLTLANAERGAEDPLLICGPEPLIPVLQGLTVVAPRLPYPVELAVLQGGEAFPLPGFDDLRVSTLLLDHEIPCLAYALWLPRAPRFDPDRARGLAVPLPLWRHLQRGEEVTIDGRRILPDAVRGPARRGLRVVLATDTKPTRALVDFLAADDGADLLIADAMYGDEEDKPKRWQAQHMTFAEAAAIARDGGARALLLTHFSPTVADPDAYRDRAAAIFPATTVGRDGLQLTLRFDE
jgi:ribonuclease Z